MVIVFSLGCEGYVVAVDFVWKRRMSRVAAVAALVVATAYVIGSQLRKRAKHQEASHAFRRQTRLPTSVVPSRYDLELTPKLNTCKFDGKLAVNVEIKQETKHIVLNAADLTINDNTVWLRYQSPRQVRFV